MNYQTVSNKLIAIKKVSLKVTTYFFGYLVTFIINLLVNKLIIV